MLQIIAAHHPLLMSITFDACDVGFEFLKETFSQCKKISVDGMSVYKKRVSTGGSDGTSEWGDPEEDIAEEEYGSDDESGE